MTSTYSLKLPEDRHVLAWDTKNCQKTSTSSPKQPWRDFWPPKDIQVLSEDEIRSKPWLTWKRDEAAPNEKPWYQWVNVFEGEVDEPCESAGCKHCGGSGCVSRRLVTTLCQRRQANNSMFLAERLFYCR